jgi:hypothetical protein
MIFKPNWKLKAIGQLGQKFSRDYVSGKIHLSEPSLLLNHSFK